MSPTRRHAQSSPSPGATLSKAVVRAAAAMKINGPETWNLSVTRDRVIWRKSDVLSSDAFEFPTSFW